jgi:hypothetical protein
LRQANAEASNTTNINGNQKTRGARRKTITLPDPGLVRKILDREA